MKKARWVVLGLVATACSSSNFCTQFGSAQSAVMFKGAACGIGDGGAMGGGRVKDCTALVIKGTACTSADQALLDDAANTYSTCVGDLSTCTTVTEAAAFGTAALVCHTALDSAVLGGSADGGATGGGVSTGCFAALSTVNTYP